MMAIIQPIKACVKASLIRGQGCYKVRWPLSSGQECQGSVELIIKSPLSMGQVGHSLPPKQADGGIVERSQQMRSVPHAQLGAILIQGEARR
ncbi:MAG: hypothetical protein JO183_11775 [Ktedonobacteraceae bacterium]|nr:hypothetical protein [Ktedonobacteraceae bacterium]